MVPAVARPMQADTRRLRFAFIASLALVIVCDGGVSYAASASALMLFSALLFLSAAVPLPDPGLRVLRLSALVVAGGLALLAAIQTRWDPSGAQAHPIWRQLAEQFGALGGTRAITRSQPVWELAGSVVPFVAFAAALPLFRRAPGERGSGHPWSAIAVLGGAFALYGLLQSMLFPTWHFGDRTAYVDSLTGFFVNRNVAAAFLILTSLATLVAVDRDLDRVDPGHWGRLIHGRSRLHAIDRRVLVDVALFALQFSALFLTKSRAGSVVGLLAIAGFVAIRGHHRFGAITRRLSWRRSAIVAGLVLTIVALLAGRVALRWDLYGLEDNRWCALPAMVETARTAWPWGVGLGGFETAYAPSRDAACGIIGIWDSAHNDYIQGLTTLGAAFPVIVVALLAAVIPPLVVACRRGLRSRSRALAALLAIAAMALHSIVDFPMEVPANGILLALMIAAALGTPPEGLPTTPDVHTRSRGCRDGRRAQPRRGETRSADGRIRPAE